MFAFALSSAFPIYFDLLIAHLSSALFLTINMWPVLKAGDKRVGVPVIITMALLHLGLALTFKFVFFTYSPIVIAPSTSP